MAKIAVMPPSLASQIAAGEVVERPASAVKELIENAIDAGATRCDVEVEGGGITRLAVIDDGCGMSREDAVLSVERHATSKLFALDDLSRIATYGFRGEALPSIASVSRLTLRTRTVDSDGGLELRIEGGSKPDLAPIGAPVGTTVEVRDLFYNVAARRKFLRSSATESGHVADVVEAAALAQPTLTVTLTRDGRRVRQWLRAADRESRVGTAFDEQLAPCRGERGPLFIEAFLGRPEKARNGAGALRFFVNGRPVRERALAHTVAQAYGSVLERGRYPRGVVYLDLPPTLVDVNVHPQKAEVRFADPRAVTDAVYHVLSVQLAQAFSLPTPPRSPWAARRDPPAHAAIDRNARPPELVQDRPGHPPQAVPAKLAGIEVTPSALVDELPAASDGTLETAERRPASALVFRDSASPISPSPQTRWRSLRFIAQVRHTYLLCDGEDGLYIIDQHAAAERVNFDRLRKQYQSRDVAAQALLFPLTLQVSATDAELVERMTAEFRALGLDVRVRGPEAVSVHSVPRLLRRASPEQLVRDLLAEASRSGGRAFSDAVDLALATMACHGSIRAGDVMTADEAAALLTALDRADFAGHCPHGRPVVAVTTWGELERKVGRR